MLISKFDLYKSEWLELVFTGRNKAYGAYELRQHNAKTMSKAMIFAFAGVFTLIGASQLARGINRNNVVRYKETEVKITEIKDDKKVIPPPPVKATPPPPVATHRFLPPEVKPDNKVNEEPPKIEDLKEAISTETHKGVTTDNIPQIDEGPATIAAAVTEDKTIYDTFNIQVMPTPMGGDEAWRKFLEKNLRFPQEAQDAGVGGKVFVSFVVEKDGSLTDITVVRGAGYGMDEEATRVLKLARPWKPGIQNGRPVRVKFIVPLNFQINEQP